MHHTRDEVIQHMIEIGRLLHQSGIFRARAGNLSACLSDDTILITRSRTHKGLLTPADFLHLDPTGTPLEAGEPSSETLLHVAAYHGSPQIRAVGHAHPINCTELAHRGIELDVTLAEEGVPVLGQPPLLDDQPKDQRARLWGESVASGTRAALLRQHGIVVAGTSVHDVLCKLELCEWIADLQLRLKR